MNAVPSALRIMLVDDHPIVRRGVSDILAAAFPQAYINEVGSGTEAMALARSQTWDIVILDLTLPDGSGLDVLKKIREAQSRLPVLILSMHTADQFARRAGLGQVGFQKRGIGGQVGRGSAAVEENLGIAFQQRIGDTAPDTTRRTRHQRRAPGKIKSFHRYCFYRRGRRAR